MIDDNRTVSVIMNCFNGYKYLRQAIESVISQSYQDWELIFWDNQSTDNSADIAQSFLDHRVRYFYAPRHTLLSEARSEAVQKAQGQFIAFLDVDDWWETEKLSQQIPYFINPEIGLVCSNYISVYQRNGKRKLALKSIPPTGSCLNDILKNYYIGLPTLILRRSAYDSLNYGFDTKYHLIGDFDLCARLLCKWKLEYVDKPLAFYRRHDEMGSVTLSSKNVEELSHWCDRMKLVTKITSNPGFSVLRNNVIYMDALDHIMKGDRIGSLRFINNLCLGIRKLKAIVALFLPIQILAALRGLK